MNIESKGIKMTDPPKSFAGTLFYGPAFDMNAEWEVELRLRIHRKELKKKTGSRKGKVDAIIVSLTNEFTGGEYQASTPEVFFPRS
jgi:hypothetical protein